MTIPGIPSTASSKDRLRIPQIARWRISGVSDTKIASLLNLTPSGLQRVLASAEYQDYEAAYLNGHLSAMDRAMSGKISILHNELRMAVPAAVRCLVDSVTQRKDLRAALSAAESIFKLDPDRTFAEAGEEHIAPGVPAEVLEAAVAEGNKVVDSLNTKPKPN